MIENINKSGYETISKPNTYVLENLEKILNNKSNPLVAELGIGIGATTLEIAKLLKGNGQIHIFDFEDNVMILTEELKNVGFDNIIPHGNSEKYWDSYHWSIQKIISSKTTELFDLIYIDGAHTYLHDCLAFFMCDRILNTGGIIVFDDYNWRYADSKYMKDIRNLYMTEEQINSCQIKLFVDQIVSNHIGYKPIVKNSVYQKVLNMWKSEE